MTASAWMAKIWGRVRETLQPELFALRRELKIARIDGEEWRQRLFNEKQHARQLAERLAQRTRELKAARAKLKKAGK